MAHTFDNQGGVYRRQHLRHVVRPSRHYSPRTRPQSAQEAAWREGVATLALLAMLVVLMGLAAYL